MSVGCFDLHSEIFQRKKMRLYGSCPKLAAPGVRQFEISVIMHQRSDHHDDTACSPSRVSIHLVEIKFVAAGVLNLEVVIFRPFDLHADTGENFNYSIDLLDARDALQFGCSVVEETGAKQPDCGIFAGFGLDRTSKCPAALNS